MPIKPVKYGIWFHLHFPNQGDWSSFQYLLVISFFLGLDFAPLSVSCLFLIDWCEPFKYCDYNVLSIIGMANIFSWSLTCVLALFMVPFVNQKWFEFLFCFCSSDLSIISSMVFGFCVLFNELFMTPQLWKYPPIGSFSTC